MRPVGSISTKTTLFGQHMSMPVFISPAGVHSLCNDEGECASARACSRVGTMFALSQHSTKSIEQVSSVGGNTNLWYQSYILKDRQMTLNLIKRAVNAGYKGIFLTVDSVRFGYREADARNGFNSLPAPHRLVNYDGELGIASSSTSNKIWHAPDSSSNVVEKSKIYNAEKEAAWDQNTELLFEQNPTWDDVRWLKKEACRDLPLIIKGIMTAEDAIEAVNAGADGIMVSNHGGRQLDGCLASIDVLEEVVEAVGDQVPILLDGGIRRGTDVLKALALGATAVGIGKPVFFSLAVGGENAVVHLLEMLQKELEAAMAICGISSISDVNRKLITRHHNGGVSPNYTRAKL